MTHSAPTVSGSYNPLKYTPAQLAKALMVLLTSTVAMLGLIASTFTEGPLENIGLWATAASLFIAPIAAFVTKAAPIVSRFGNPFAEG